MHNESTVELIQESERERMRKSGKGNKPRKGKKAKNHHSSGQQALGDAGKRSSLKLIRNGALALSLVGVAGYFAVSGYARFQEEKDLSKIGNGKPSIVQIHDPNCPVCNELQKETRKALSNFDDDTFNYLVANIKTTEGSAFARKHGQPHITLMLFDEKGGVKQVLRGSREAEELTNAFSFIIR